MPETHSSQGPQAAPTEPVPELEAKEIDKLADLVYRLMKRELLLQRERRGTAWLNERR